MASIINVPNTERANTFDQWRINTNLLRDDVNEIARGDFTKPTGNVTISDGAVTISKGSGVTFTVASDSRISGKLSVHTIESDTSGHVYLSAGDIVMNNRSSGAVFQANINTVFTSANVTISNTTVGGTFNVASNTNISAQNVMITNSSSTGLFEVTPNTIFYRNVNVASVLNVQTGNIASLWVQDLTVQSPIAGPVESTGSYYRLRSGQATRQDGAFGVQLGSTANGNAWINFDTVHGNVWRVTENSSTGVYRTLITSGNVSDSPITTSSINVASLTAVKAAYDHASDAYNAANASYGQANTATTNAGNAYNQANSAYSAANNISSGATALTLKGYKDYLVTNTNVNGANTVDMSVSNWYKYTLTTSPTITFANAPPAGTGGTVTIVTIQGSGGGKSITWANTIYWAGGQVPPATTTTTGNTDIWTFFTFDGGSTYIGTLAVKDAR